MNWNNQSYIITRLEVLDQTNGSGGELNTFAGGVGYGFADLYFEALHEGSSIDFIVNIFGELITPNHFFFGELTNDSELLYRSRIVEEMTGAYSFYWRGYDYMITRIEARDQSIGNGGRIYNYYVGSNSTILEFTSVFNSSRIDFIIDIYGEPLQSAEKL